MADGQAGRGLPWRRGRPARSDAWFVRVRGPGRYAINPCSPRGWLVTIGYTLFALAITPVILPGTPVRIAAWAVLFGAATILFCVVAWRTSAPAVEDPQRGDR